MPKMPNGRESTERGGERIGLGLKGGQNKSEVKRRWTRKEGNSFGDGGDRSRRGGEKEEKRGRK